MENPGSRGRLKESPLDILDELLDDF